MTHRKTVIRVSIDSLESRCHLTAAAASVNLGTTYQTIDAFGAASTAWYYPDELSNPAFYDLIVNDLGATGARGAVSPMFEVANDNADPNTFDWSRFDTSALAHVLNFDQRLQERGAGHFFLTVWTPPWWMKTNMAHNGGGSLRPDMRAEFAEYLAAVVISAKRDFGVTLDGISLQNEQVFIEEYESSLMDNVSMRETVIAVQQKFAREGLTTPVIANEDLNLFPDQTRWNWFNEAMLEAPEVDKSRLVIGAHHTDPSLMAGQASQLAGTGVPLWYTEISGEPNTWAGALNTTRTLSDTLTKANASAYYYWLYNYLPGPAESGALLANGVPGAKFYGLKHYYKYVRPGMQRVDTNIDETAGARLAAFKDASTGRMTLVLLNSSSSSLEVTLSLSGFAAGSPAFRGFVSTESAYWQSTGNVSATNGVMHLSAPASGILTLTNLDERAPIPGIGSTPVNIPVLRDADSNNPLRNAALLGQLSTVQSLIAGGADVNAADPVSGWTPLHAATASAFPGAETMVAALLAAGANPHARTIEGFTPLHAVAMNQVARWNANYFGRGEIINQLVNVGADVNARDNAGRTPLMWTALTIASYSATAYNPYAPTTLTQRGADRTLRDNAGRAAYDYAMQEYKQPFADYWLGGNNTDTLAPYARDVRFDRSKNSVQLTITENVVPTLDAADVQVINLATGQPTTGWTFEDRFSNGLTFATLHFNARLPDGRYRVTINAGVFTDQSGMVSTQPVSYTFGSLGADATGDGTVGFDDLLVLSQNYGRSGRTFAQGDFNDDGVVDFDDLLALSQRYGKSLVVNELVAAKPSSAARKR